MLVRSLFLASFLALSCTSKSSSEDKPSSQEDKSDSEEEEENNDGPGTLAVGSVSLNVAAINSLDAQGSAPAGASDASPGTLAISSSLNLSNQGTNLPADPPNVVGELNAITSGPPDGLRIKIKKITFITSEGSDATVFEDEEGAQIEITGAKVDLSELIEKAAGGEGQNVEFSVAEGEYSSIKVEYFVAADIKGCVKGTFETLSAKAEYINEHEYCTQTEKSLYKGSKTYNSDFENVSDSKSAEWMTIHLGAPSEDIKFPSEPEDSTFEVNYDLASSFTVTKDESIDLSLVIDMNRLLRYNNGGKDIPSNYDENDNTTKNPAYFFDSTFRSVAFVFAGKPGRIYGYDVLSLVCEDSELDKTTDPDAPTCGGDGFYAVNTWMTLVMDPDGKPLTMFIQPQDDTRLTTLVGSHFRDGSQWIFAGSASDNVDLRYNMDSPDDSNFRGTIFDFPSDLEAADPTTTPSNGHFMAYWDLHDEDDKDRQGNDIYPSSTKTYPYNKTTSGVAYFWRKL